MTRTLRDMVVVITGASAGIGRALAIHLAARGAKLVLCARRIDRLHELCKTLGPDHLCLRADVANPDDCAELMRQAAARFTRIDTLVCNAGYGLGWSVAQTSAAAMTDIFKTNVFGTTDCIRPAVPIMLAQSLRDSYRGQIVIVSSAVARRGVPFIGPYAATKAAQLSIAEALRVELAPARIAVTSVHPVGTTTDFFTTAAALSNTHVAPHGNWIQSVDTVARKMARAIEKPRPELWPMPIARWGLNLTTFFPAITDYFLGKVRDSIAGKAASPDSNKSDSSAPPTASP